MAVIVKNKKGKEVILLNPHEKAKKAKAELRDGCKKTNSMLNKKTKSGGKVNLTSEERAYRAGYVQHYRDSAAVYKSKKK